MLNKGKLIFEESKTHFIGRILFLGLYFCVFVFVGTLLLILFSFSSIVYDTNSILYGILFGLISYFFAFYGFFTKTFCALRIQIYENGIIPDKCPINFLLRKNQYFIHIDNIKDVDIDAFKLNFSIKIKYNEKIIINKNFLGEGVFPALEKFSELFYKQKPYKIKYEDFEVTSYVELYGKPPKKDSLKYMLQNFLFLYFLCILGTLIILISEFGTIPTDDFPIQNLVFLMVILALLILILLKIINVISIRNSNPVIYENGLLLPPKTLIDAWRNQWEKYSISRIDAICPEFILTHGTKKSINFYGYLIKFNNGREQRIRPSLGGPLTDVLRIILKDRFSSLIKPIEEYYDFKNINTDEIEDLFKDVNYLLAKPLIQSIYLMGTIVWICGVLILGIILPNFISYYFSIFEGKEIIFTILIIGILFGVPYSFFLTRSLNRITKKIVLLHLIEFERKYDIKIIPTKFQKKAQRFLEIIKMVPRTDLELTAKLLGKKYKKDKKYFEKEALREISKRIIEIEGKKVVFYQNKIRKEIEYLSIILITLSIIFLLLYILKLEIFHNIRLICCIPIILIGFTTGTFLPGLFPKQIGFSLNFLYIENQLTFFSKIKTEVIQWNNISEVTLDRKGPRAKGDNIIKNDGSKILIGGIDNTIQEEIYNRFQKFKKQNKFENQI